MVNTRRVLLRNLFLYISIILLSAFIMNNQISKKDIVPDAETAKKIAEAIWLPIYGKKIYKKKPFIVTLRNNIWEVKGTLHTQKGGVPYIEIQKSDCKILKVTHGK